MAKSAKKKAQKPQPRHAGKAPKAPAKKPTFIAAPQPTVEEYVSKVPPWQRSVIEQLRALIKKAAPRAAESLKWGQPVYEHKGPFSYIKAHTAQINFGFWRGAELDDPKRLLQGEGIMMRHVRIMEEQALDEAVLTALVVQAVKLNEKKGDPTRG